jgi:hypothetical protein
VGQIQPWAKLCPQGLFPLSKISFLFLFLISFDFCLETLQNPSNLNQANFYKFVKLFFKTYREDFIQRT